MPFGFFVLFVCYICCKLCLGQCVACTCPPYCLLLVPPSCFLARGAPWVDHGLCPGTHLPNLSIYLLRICSWEWFSVLSFWYVLNAWRDLLVSSCGVIPTWFEGTCSLAKIMLSARLPSSVFFPACSSCLFNPSPQTLLALLTLLRETACCSTWHSCSWLAAALIHPTPVITRVLLRCRVLSLLMSQNLLCSYLLYFVVWIFYGLSVGDTRPGSFVVALWTHEASLCNMPSAILRSTFFVLPAAVLWMSLSALLAIWSSPNILPCFKLCGSESACL